MTCVAYERATEFEDEVVWGESAEEAVVQRWLPLSLYAKGARRVVKSSHYDDYDFFLLSKQGLPVVFVEIKVRRTKFALYGDAIFPHRKHDFAKRLAAFKIPFIGVTQYGCGTLVEVDLRVLPAIRKDVVRRDRPGMEPVSHAFYAKEQLAVLCDRWGDKK